MGNTCGKCRFYEAAGKGRDNADNEFAVGFCFGAPPSVAASRSEYPTVKQDQRECALWQKLATSKR